VACLCLLPTSPNNDEVQSFKNVKINVVRGGGGDKNIFTDAKGA